MFGRTVSQYLGFQRVFLVMLAVAGLAQLGLSLAGLPDTTVRWLSMNGSPPLLLWGVSSLVLLITKRRAPRPAVA